MDDKSISASTFDAFDFIGIVAPGLLFILGCRFLFPTFMASLPQSSFTLGDFAVLAVVSFATGHLMQGLGNILESVFWSLLGGWPTERLVAQSSSLLTKSQKAQIQSRLSTDSNKLARAEVRAMFVAARSRADTARIDKFGRNYVFARGLFSSLLLLLFLYLIFGVPTEIGIIAPDWHSSLPHPNA